jgi:hypothetical protein
MRASSNRVLLLAKLLELCLDSLVIGHRLLGGVDLRAQLVVLALLDRKLLGLHAVEHRQAGHFDEKQDQHGHEPQLPAGFPRLGPPPSSEQVDAYHARTSLCLRSESPSATAS